MTPTRFTIRTAIFVLLTATPALAKPAYVITTVNLRSAAGTSNEIMAKIPGGSLVDATNCANGWCEVEWQGKKGYAIATALDQSGRVPARRAPARVYGDASEYVPVGPPIYGPPVYAYPYRPYYYRPYYWGYGWGYRRWRW